MRYIGDWYGEQVIWEDYEYKKTEDDPSYWPDKEMRVKPIHDHRINGGFSLKYALDENIVTLLTNNTRKE